MIIGLDLDDVIFKTSESLKSISLIKCADKVLLNNKVDLMRGSSNNKIIDKKIKDFLKENMNDVIENAEPMENARNIIKLLKEKSNTIVLITARGDKYSQGSEIITKKSLEKYKIEYDSIVYNSIDKAKDCRENNVELFVDDSPQNCIEVKNNLNIPVIGFKSAITAEEFEKIDLDSVSSWNELYEKLKSIINL